MRIAICDDSARHLLAIAKKVKKILNRYNSDNKYNITIQEFTSTTEILQAHEKLKFDVAFLDVDMPNMSGFDVADLMYNLSPRMKIIYVTSHQKYIKESINHEVFSFVTKGVDEDYEEAIHKLLKDYDDCHSQVKFEIIRDDELSIYDIMYFTAGRNCVIAHTADGKEIKLRASLSEVEEENLEKYCFRIDRSTIVNFYFVYNVIGRDVNLYDGTILKVSRDRAKEIRKKHRLYCIDRDSVFDENVVYLESDDLDGSPLTLDEMARNLNLEKSDLKRPKDKWWKI